MDDIVCVLETDKVSVDVRSPNAGELVEQLAAAQQVVAVGAPLGKIRLGAGGAKAVTAAAPKAAAPAAAVTVGAPAPKAAASTPVAAAPAVAKPAAPAPAAAKPAAAPVAPAPPAGSRAERRVPMTRLRQTVAKRLKESQNTYASLTTFNEIDMSNAINLRNKYKDEFEKKHGVKLSFMSFFVRAASSALKEYPMVNAVINPAGTEIIYRDFQDVSVAVSTPTGLVVP